eukprot:m.173882 g.173882  ORF g.173882 m.173882 type:complete len:71 (-) comp13502_c1_seq48:2682-2894(-)
MLKMNVYSVYVLRWFHFIVPCNGYLNGWSVYGDYLRIPGLLCVVKTMIVLARNFAGVCQRDEVCPSIKVL